MKRFVQVFLIGWLLVMVDGSELFFFQSSSGDGNGGAFPNVAKIEEEQEEKTYEVKFDDAINQAGEKRAQIERIVSDYLYVAVEKNNLIFLEKIYKKHPQVIKKDKMYGRIGYWHHSLLHLAVREGYEDIVGFLLLKGWIIAVEDNHTNTPLYLAVKYNKIKCAKLIVDEMEKTQGWEATKNTEWKTILHMLAGWADLKEGYWKSLANEIVKFKSELVNQTDKLGATPLHIAVETENANAIDFFLGQKDIDLTIQNNHEEGLMHIFAKRKKYSEDKNKEISADWKEAVEKLIRKDSNILNMQGKDGNTPLHVAIKYNDLDVVNLFLNQKDIDVNKANTDGNDPLGDALNKSFGTLGSMRGELQNVFEKSIDQYKREKGRSTFENIAYLFAGSGWTTARPFNSYIEDAIKVLKDENGGLKALENKLEITIQIIEALSKRSSRKVDDLSSKIEDFKNKLNEDFKNYLKEIDKIKGPKAKEKNNAKQTIKKFFNNIMEKYLNVISEVITSEKEIVEI